MRQPTLRCMTSTLWASSSRCLVWRWPKKVDLTTWIRSAQPKKSTWKVESAQRRQKSWLEGSKTKYFGWKSWLETLKTKYNGKKVELEGRKKNFATKKSTWKAEKFFLRPKSRVGSLKKIFWAKKVDLGIRKKNFVANKLSWRSEKNVLHRKSRLDDFNPFSAAQKSWLGRPNPLGAGKKVDLTAQE